MLIGADLQNVIALDMSGTSPNVIKALACFDAESTIGDIILKCNLDTAESEDFLYLAKYMLDNKIIESPFSKEDSIRKVGLSESEYNRFDRQINLFKHVSGNFDNALLANSKLKDAKITIVGLGGCGSYVFYTLSAMGVGHIKSYDFDIVEESNLSRQILYNYSDLGKKKVEVARDKAPYISPSTQYEFYDEKIDNIEKACRLFEKADLVICAADDPRPDFFHLMNEAAFNMSGALLYAASATVNAIVGPLIIPGKTRCYACVNQNHMKDVNEFEFVKTIKQNYMNTLIDPYNAVAGSLAALEAVKYLTDFDKCQIIEKTLFINFSNYKVDKTEDSYSGYCPICNKT
ncbi:ThiF family adenylyltransferase [Bartonella sp. MM73XJBT]|uniref:HesA/MoeB/ThiF family protein n=1 Tax=Bartonella sp. MM73XJBT TaxID=3019095 RepID=UPI00235EEDA3